MGNTSDQHLRSRRYWAAATDTFLGSSEYYEKQGQVLQTQILPKVGQVRSALDIGCGNGRYTLQIAEYADLVIGVDIGRSLIEEAHDQALREGVRNVAYVVSELETFSFPIATDLVGCMGVTSCLYDDGVRDSLLAGIEATLAPKGFLILKDTISKGDQDVIFESGEYLARYRTLPRYLDFFQRSNRDWNLLESVTLQDDPGLINNLLLFQVE